MDGSDVIDSPAWWFEKLLQGFDARRPDLWRSPGTDPEPNWNDTRRQRFERLWAYFTGRAPLPQVAAEYTEIFRAVMRKARSNYAPMPINALRNRMVLVGVSTKADNDTGGDDMAAEIARVSNLKVMVQDLLAYLFVMGESYGMVVPPKPGSTAKPMITALDPRNTFGDPSPDNPNVLRAALVRTCDPLFGVERASLFLPGKRFPVKRALSPYGGVSLGKWEWDGDPEDVLGIDHLGGIPIVRLDNENGMGEFEAHIDLLDRINDTTLQRMVIAWYQSFRQRAVVGDLEGDTDDAEVTSEEVDWNEMFRADPGALWRVPAGVEFWESGQADLGPIVNAKRDDVKEFGILTSTPLHMFAPDSANQTAEGASLTREGINFKVEDRRGRVEPKLALLHEMAFAFAGDPKRGEGIRLQWGALETNSLGDKGSASAQAKGVLSLRNNLIEIWGMTPTQAEENITQLTADQLLALSTASQQPAPQTPPAQQDAGQLASAGTV